MPLPSINNSEVHIIDYIGSGRQLHKSDTSPDVFASTAWAGCPAAVCPHWGFDALAGGRAGGAQITHACSALFAMRRYSCGQGPRLTFFTKMASRR